MRVLALLLAIAVLGKPADACSCLQRTIDEVYRSAKHVLVAKVLRQLDDDGDGYRVFEVEVEGVWKGPAKHAMRVATGHGGGDCGRSLTKGQRWILFANEKHDTMFTSICDASHLSTKDAIVVMTTRFGSPKNPKH